jgi:hypothetical protein
MESAVLGVTLDSSIVITAERKSLPVSQLIEAILKAHPYNVGSAEENYHRHPDPIPLAEGIRRSR